MSVKLKIWFVPIIATIIFALGTSAVLLFSSATLRTINSIGETQYPYLDATTKFASQLHTVSATIQSAVRGAEAKRLDEARAGEQGRGFAVVASEVRSLAGRSAQAAKEIGALIKVSVDQVNHGSHLVERAGSTMQEIVAAAGAAISKMDEATQQNAALVEEAAAAASSLEEQAVELVRAMARFKLGDEKEPHTPSASAYRTSTTLALNH